MADKKKIELTLTAAVGIAGKIVVPGKNPKKPDCVVSESIARNLLQRGKATLFGSQDLEGTEIVDPADPDPGAGQGSDATPGAGSGAAPAKPAAKGKSAGAAK